MTKKEKAELLDAIREIVREELDARPSIVFSPPAPSGKRGGSSELI